MRHILRVTSSIILVAIALVLCAGAKDESLEELKARYETAHPEDRPVIAVRIAQRELHDVDQFFNDGNVEKADAAVAEVVSYSEKARDAAIETQKHLKNVEIDVRKIADKLRDIKRTIAFDDQPPVEQAVRRLEEIRTSLLKAMFANEKKTEKK